MNKSTKSLLLVAMMAVSGFAVAQAAASDVPNSRAAVKAQATPQKAGTDGGEGPSAAEKGAPGAMAKSRAEVKSGATPMKAGTDGGEGPVPNSTKMTAAERRAANASAPKRPKVSKADVEKDGKAAPN